MTNDVRPHRSSIPTTAVERVIERYASGAAKRVELRVGEDVVGVRELHETGELAAEWPKKRGRLHGVARRWDEPGVLLSAEPYRDGLPHGVAKQWDGGEVVGTYTMVRGSGLDLWWGHDDDGERILVEARRLRAGARDGFEWWIHHDQRSVYQESHFVRDEAHGIERQWNAEQRLRRGYPKYWVEGAQVTKRAYVSACERDPKLPPFRERDNEPKRSFPPEVAVALGRPMRRTRARR